MAEDFDAPNKGAGAWGQAATALALVGALGVGFWVLAQSQSSSTATPRPATCRSGKPEKTPAETGNAPWHASGTQLCEALHRPDLAELLGTPGESAKSASGSGGSVEVDGEEKAVTPSARVEFETYTVTLRADRKPLTIATASALLGDGAPPRTVLGRPGFLYSDRTISLSFRLDGSDSHSVPGVPARVLVVSRDEKDSGGLYEVTVWRRDGMLPDDLALLRVAEKVLPTVPGWSGVTPPGP